ncbi:MAG: 23S rRNA (adenine(2503)-C(2))-methyltransferase RlmN [Planctomycetota bacterium]
MTAAVTDLTDHQLEPLITRLGGKAFHARQLARWVYARGATSLDECTDLAKSLRTALREHVTLRGSTVAATERATDGTAKMLVRLADGETVETVIIPDQDRVTLCVSTQVGCPVACVFCASGLEGVRRNLTSGEITEQVLHARDQLASRQLTNVVIMGMGEPMLNLPALVPALERMRDPDGIGLGARRITVSTSGYPDRMDRFAATPHQYQLAVSLHAADDELRRRLVPTARAPVAAIVAAAARYGTSKNREVTFEVVLLAGVNDRPKHAQDLVERLRRVPCTVNLIPWNPVGQIRDLRAPATAAVDAFAEQLRRGGLKTTVRRQRGADKSAACGQLRIRELNSRRAGLA